MVPAHPIGKITTVMQLVLIGILVIEFRSLELIYITIALSFISGFYYVSKGIKALGNAK